MWSFNERNLYDMLCRTARLWVGHLVSGGKIYTMGGLRCLLEKDVDERQIVAVLPGEPVRPSPHQTPKPLYRIVKGRTHGDLQPSAALDAEADGPLRHVVVEGRPDIRRTARDDLFPPRLKSGSRTQHGRTGTEPREGAVSSHARRCPLGRDVQWRAAGREAEGSSPRFYEVEPFVRQENVPPKISLSTS